MFIDDDAHLRDRQGVIPGTPSRRGARDVEAQGIQAERSGRAALRLRPGDVELQREIVTHLPVDIQAGRLQGFFDAQGEILEKEIRGTEGVRGAAVDDFLQPDRRGRLRVAVELHVGVIGRLVPDSVDQSHRMLRVLGVKRIGRDRQRVAGRKLHRKLSVDALALIFIETDTDIAGPGDNGADFRLVDDVRAGHAPAELGIRAPHGREPLLDTHVAAAGVALLVAAENGNTEARIVVDVAVQRAEFGSHFVAGLVSDALGADAELFAGAKGPDRLDVDGRANATRRFGSTAGLVNLNAADAFGGQILEIEGTGHALVALVCRVAGNRGDVCRGHLPAVDRHQVEVRPEAANRDFRSFAVDAVDGHAGYALQGFGEVGVRHLADILGGNRIDNARRAALDIQRPLQAAADARDHDLFDDPVVLRMSRRRAH